MSAEDRIKKLEQQRAAIERQIRQQKAKIKSEERKRETRRKIILGGLIETHCEMHPESAIAREVPRLIERFVKGDKERELFGLEPLPAGKNEPEPKDHFTSVSNALEPQGQGGQA